MKPKDYIEKYSLKSGWNTKHQTEFLNDFTSELLAFCEYNKALNNLKGFDNALRVVRQKWDSISNKIPKGLPESLWKYFFATTISKIREEMCPEQMQRRRQEAEDRRIQREAWRKRREEEEKMWNDMARDAYFERLALLLLSISAVPTSSFQYLNLETTASQDEIKKRYRELSIKAHPDSGGSQEEFITLTDHKNKCLKWAQMNR